jgi:hypothetical protein
MNFPERIEAFRVRLFIMPTQLDSREAVIIDVLEDAASASRKITGEIEKFENPQLILLTADEINVSAGISARGEHLLFKGTVIRCVPREETGWEVHVRLKRTLLVV